MRLGVSIRREKKLDPETVEKTARELESAGADVLWVSELYGFDGASLMGFLAAVTKRVQIGSAILPFYSRSPALMAMTAAGIDAISAGRCILGIGSSGPQVVEGFHGVPFDGPVGRLEEIIDICRTIWSREPLVYDGKYYQVPLPEERGTGLGKPLKLIDHPVRDRIPIFVASLGPKNVEATARVADGWLPTIYWPDRWEQAWADSLRAGLAKRDSALGPLEVAANVRVAIGEDLDELRETVRPDLAFQLGGMGARDRNFYNNVACRYGLQGPAKEIQELFLSGQRDAAAKVVPTELLEGTTMIGPAGYVKERLDVYREAGVTILNVRPVGPDPLGTIRFVREHLA